MTTKDVRRLVDAGKYHEAADLAQSLREARRISALCASAAIQDHEACPGCDCSCHDSAEIADEQIRPEEWNEIHALLCHGHSTAKCADGCDLEALPDMHRLYEACETDREFLMRARARAQGRMVI
uniref:Uncharacterized protein n=1 Tax=viral metagenome TaxID=1070528 RepID=A0A6M3IKI2_9ZZZZ